MFPFDHHADVLLHILLLVVDDALLVLDHVLNLDDDVAVLFLDLVEACLEGFQVVVQFLAPTLGLPSTPTGTRPAIASVKWRKIPGGYRARLDLIREVANVLELVLNVLLHLVHRVAKPRVRGLADTLDLGVELGEVFLNAGLDGLPEQPDFVLDGVDVLLVEFVHVVDLLGVDLDAGLDVLNLVLDDLKSRVLFDLLVHDLGDNLVGKCCIVDEIHPVVDLNPAGLVGLTCQGSGVLGLDQLLELRDLLLEAIDVFLGRRHG